MRIHFFQHVPFEGLGVMEVWFNERRATISSTQLFQNPVLPDPNDFDVLIVMGGPMGANDDQRYPWLKTEKQCIEKAMALKKKVLGICLGAQLIADVLGAKVYQHREKEIGWFPISKVYSGKSHKLIESFPEKVYAFHWHGDTFDLPQGAMHLFKSEGCENQAFLWQEGVLGLQFHLEMTQTGAGALIEACRNEMISSRFVQSEKAIFANPERFKESNSLMHELLNRFLP